MRSAATNVAARPVPTAQRGTPIPCSRISDRTARGPGCCAPPWATCWSVRPWVEARDHREKNPRNDPMQCRAVTVGRWREKNPRNDPMQYRAVTPGRWPRKKPRNNPMQSGGARRFEPPDRPCQEKPRNNPMQSKLLTASQPARAGREPLSRCLRGETLPRLSTRFQASGTCSMVRPRKRGPNDCA
jgi:hypothetical protein